MIKSIKLTNFFSFKDAKIELNNDLNILVGINGSGKSNFLKAIHLLKEGTAGNGLKELILEKWGGIDEIFFKGQTKEEFQNSIGLEFVFNHQIINKYGSFFKQDIIYKIVIIKTPGLNN